MPDKRIARLFRSVGLLVLLALAGACRAPIEVVPPRTPEQGSTVTVQGTVHYQDLEGGFYTLASESGQVYNLVGLPPEHRQEGLRVEVTGLADPDTATMHMRGTPLNVEKVQVLHNGEGQ
ncbi:MAG: hypothetical protein ACOCWT_01930 [Desulfohalobiaceae bacterium]